LHVTWRIILITIVYEIDYSNLNENPEQKGIAQLLLLRGWGYLAKMFGLAASDVRAVSLLLGVTHRNYHAINQG